MLPRKMKDIALAGSSADPAHHGRMMEISFQGKINQMVLPGKLNKIH